MITQISGEVVNVNENSVTLQVREIAYEVLVPSSVINLYKKKITPESRLEPNADTFHTIQYIEGSSGHGNQFMRLVGFKRKIEKDFFLAYTSVEGIGYRTALRSLTLPIQKIAMAIESNDIPTLKKLPHIGGRTAEKMVATLRGRMRKFALDMEGGALSAPVEGETDYSREVMQVLDQVGYNEGEALRLIAHALEINPKVKSAEEMIAEIFKFQNAS